LIGCHHTEQTCLDLLEKKFRIQTRMAKTQLVHEF
jgi:hypothetical protein